MSSKKNNTKRQVTLSDRVTRSQTTDKTGHNSYDDRSISRDTYSTQETNTFPEENINERNIIPTKKSKTSSAQQDDIVMTDSLPPKNTRPTSPEGETNTPRATTPTTHQKINDVY